MSEAAVCIANIGPRQRAMRMWFGLIALGLGVAVGATLVFMGASHLSRLAVFLPFWIAGIGVFQAVEKT